MTMSSNSLPVAVVTGGSRGIGAAITRRLVKDGFHVVVNYSTNDEAANKLVSEIQTEYGKGHATAIKADMRSLGDIQSLAKQSIALGTVTFLCLNAGIAPAMHLDGITPEVYDDVFNVNLRGHLFLTQALVPQMPAFSSIVAISSCVTHMTNVPSTCLLYTASKAALEKSLQVLAKELAPKQIRLNTVSPGPIMSELYMEINGRPDRNSFWNQLSPAEKIGGPEDVSGIVSFFAGPDSRWISGQEIRVDGAGTVN